MRFFICSSREKVPDRGSKAIMRWINADWSHILIMVVMDDGVKRLFHAVEKGVCEVRYDEFMLEHIFPHEVEITSFIKSEYEALGWLRGSVGKAYSFGQYFGFVFPRLRRYFSNKNAKMICSEFGAEFVDQNTMIDCFAGDGRDYIDPRQIIEQLKVYVARFL